MRPMNDNPYQIRKEHGRFHHWLDGEYVGWISCENRETDRWTYLVFNQNGSRTIPPGTKAVEMPKSSWTRGRANSTGRVDGLRREARTRDFAPATGAGVRAMNATDYTIKIRRDGRQFAYTVTSPDRKIAVHEGRFFNRGRAKNKPKQHCAISRHLRQTHKRQRNNEYRTSQLQPVLPGPENRRGLRSVIQRARHRPISSSLIGLSVRVVGRTLRILAIAKIVTHVTLFDLAGLKSPFHALERFGVGFWFP